MSRPELELFLPPEEEAEEERNGAVRIADGWSRTSMFGPDGFGEDEGFGERFERTFGIRKTQLKSSRTSLRTR
jgi:hypothetical protein